MDRLFRFLVVNPVNLIDNFAISLPRLPLYSIHQFWRLMISLMLELYRGLVKVIRMQEK